MFFFFSVQVSGQLILKEKGKSRQNVYKNVFFFSLAQKPKVSENDFEDLLPNQGFSKSDKKGPKTMAEMRKQDLARDTDPLKLKVGTLRDQTTL